MNNSFNMAFHPKAIAVFIVACGISSSSAFTPASKSASASKNDLTRVNIATGLPNMADMLNLGGNNNNKNNNVEPEP